MILKINSATGKVSLIGILTLGFLIIFSFAFVTAGEYKPHKINTELSFTFTDDEAGQCNITTMDLPNGSFVWINQIMAQTRDTFSGSIDGGNFTQQGVHCIWMECADGYGSVCRDVTTNGEIPNGSKISLSVVLLLVLVCFFIISLIGLFSMDGYMAKFIFYWISHVLLVGLSFVAWQTSVNYLSMGGGIGGLFKTLFYVSTIAVTPMVFVSVAWVVYIHSYNEHFQKLLEKGESPETAFKMANKKRGWLSGN